MKIKNRIHLLVFIMVFEAVIQQNLAQENIYRTWTAEKNGVIKKIEGTFIRYDADEGRFHFVRQNGQTFSIEKKALSAGDLYFLQNNREKTLQVQKEAEHPPAGLTANERVIWQRAQQGDADAQYTMGEILMTGDPQNEDVAASWWTRAAAQGHKESRLVLEGLQEVKDENARKANPNDLRMMRDPQDEEFDNRSRTKGWRSGDRSIGDVNQNNEEYVYKRDGNPSPVGLVENDKLYPVTYSGQKVPGSSPIAEINNGTVYRLDANGMRGEEIGRAESTTYYSNLEGSHPKVTKSIHIDPPIGWTGRSPIDNASPFKAWNSPLGINDDLTTKERKAYGLPQY